MVLGDRPHVAIGATLGVAGAASVLWAGLLALRQQTFKRVVAYSTISQVGYLFLLFPLAATAAGDPPLVAAAWTATALLVAGHALSKASIFLVAGSVKAAAGSDRLADQIGAARYLPMPALAAGLAAVGLAGLPFSLGFLAKWQLMSVAVALGSWWVIAVVLAGSVLAAAYLLRPLSALLAARNGDPAAPGSGDGQLSPARRLGLRSGIVPLLLASTAVVGIVAGGWLETLASIGVSGP